METHRTELVHMDRKRINCMSLAYQHIVQQRVHHIWRISSPMVAVAVLEVDPPSHSKLVLIAMLELEMVVLLTLEVLLAIGILVELECIHCPNKLLSH